MKINKKRLILCLAVPLLGGGLAGLVTMNSMKAFATLNQPPLSPPGWLFPVVWTVLYALMGIASYLASASDAEQEEKRGALWAYGIPVADRVFQFEMVFFCFPMAGDAVGVDPHHAAAIRTDSQAFRAAADSLSAVGGFRRIPEPGGLSA